MLRSILIGLILFSTTALAGWDARWPLKDNNISLYHPVLLSNLVGAVNERCLVSGVATMAWASAASGYVTRAKLELIDAKIAELFATRRWVETRHAVGAEYNGWYRKSYEDPPASGLYTTNWTAYLPRMNKIETFDTLPVGITRMVYTNVWDYRDTNDFAEAWWTLWPAKPHKPVIASYIWITNGAWVAAAEAYDSGKHKVTVGFESGYWVDSRFYYATDGSQTRGSSYNISNLSVWGSMTDDGPPLRPPALSGRFYEANGMSTPDPAPKVYYYTNGWGPAGAGGDVTADLVGWQYLSNNWPSPPTAWSFDTQAVAEVMDDGVRTVTVSPGDFATLPEVFFRATLINEDASPGDRYHPNRFLKANNPGLHEGDRLTFMWNEAALDLYGGPSVFTEETHNWASALFAEALDERYYVLNSMRWTTSTNFGWAVSNICVINDTSGGSADVHDYVQDDGTLDPSRGAPAQTQVDRPWGAQDGYGQATIGGMTPANEDFGWQCPHDTGNANNFKWPGNAVTPNPDFFLQTNALANPTNEWVCESGLEDAPQYLATWKAFYRQDRMASYWTDNPEYWAAVQLASGTAYEPSGYCKHGTNEYYWPIVGRYHVGAHSGVGGIGYDGQYLSVDGSSWGELPLMWDVHYTNVLSRPWVDLGLAAPVLPQLPTFTVDFYLYATNAWWSDDAPQYIPVKRQSAVGGPNMGVVTGAAESAQAAWSCVAGDPLTNTLFQVDNSTVERGIDTFETNILFHFEMEATPFTTSFWFCVTNRYHDPGQPDCVYTNGGTNWIQTSVDYWRISNSIPVWTFLCDEDATYWAVANPADPTPSFTPTYDWIPHAYSPIQTCYEWEEGTVTVAQTEAILNSDHSQWVSNVVMYVTPACIDDWVYVEGVSLESLEWWSFQPATNIVVGQWEPVIKWDFEYLSP